MPLSKLAKNSRQNLARVRSKLPQRMIGPGDEFPSTLVRSIMCQIECRMKVEWPSRPESGSPVQQFCRQISSPNPSRPAMREYLWAEPISVGLFGINLR